MIFIFWAIPFIFAVFAVSVIVGIIPATVMRLLRMRKASLYWTYLTGSWVGWSCLFFCGVKIHVSGEVRSLRQQLAEKRALCYVVNHTSLLDIPVAVGPLHLITGYVTKLSVAFVPVFNLWLFAMHCVLINRKSLKRGAESIRRGAEKIKRGMPMLIFPEGTRSRTGEIGVFRSGSFRLATESGADIVALTIRGVRYCLEERRCFFKRRDCYVHVGNTYSTKDLKDRTDVRNLVQKIETEIRNTYDAMPDKG